mgnify:CR=1 FL=1
MMTLTTNNTMKEIANRYNELADVKVDTVKLSKLGKAKVLAKLEILEQEFAKKQTKTKAKAKQRKPKSGIGLFIKDMLLVVKEDGFGYSHQEIIEMVKEKFPENAATMKYLQFIQYKMNVNGVELPKRQRVK